MDYLTVLLVGLFIASYTLIVGWKNENREGMVDGRSPFSIQT